MFSRKKRFHKKAQGEQFNWIFIIIAGAVLLSFFAVFTSKYIQLKQTQMNAEMGRKFGMSIDLLQNSPIVSDNGLSIDDNDANEEGAFQIGMLSDIVYSCNEDEASVTFNDDPKSTQHLERDFVFAPEKMRVNALDLWVIAWQYPFFISNVVFLSDPKAHYYFIYDTANEGFVKDLYVPPNLEAEKVLISKIGSIKPTSSELAIFVFFMNDKANLKSRVSNAASKYDTSIIKHVKITDAEDETGEVSFYDDAGNQAGKAIMFFGKPLMWGAIFSQDADTFNCAKGKLVKKVAGVSGIYNAKANLLSKDSSGLCQAAYSQLVSTLSKMGKSFEKDGYKLRKQADEQNDNIEKVGDCLPVF